MVGLGVLAKDGRNLMKKVMVSQLTDLLSSGISTKSSSSPKSLKPSKDQEDILRVHVDGIKNFTLNKTKEILVKMALVGKHNWYCEGKTKAQPLDSTKGKCRWDECIEFSRLSDYTELKIKVGYYKRFGRFKVLACSRLPLSSIKKVNNKPQWFLLYKDKKCKQKCGSMQMMFELPDKSMQSSSNSTHAEQTQQPSENSNKAICSDYLLKMVKDLRAQVEERDQRIKSMQSYIDQMLIQVLQNCPQILEK